MRRSVALTLLRSYAVVEGRLHAGAYPPAPEALAAAGITLALDLTAEGERPPYAGRLPAGVRSERFGVPDFGVPDKAGMTAILDRIDDALAGGEVVYVHCRAGIGRTGTVVGCWLVRHGASGEAALARLAGWNGVPETPEQRRLVAGWHERPAAE